MFVADQDFGLQIIDIKDPKNAFITSSFQTAGKIKRIKTKGYAEDITLSKDGRYAYIAAGTFGLQIVDIKNINNVHTIARLDTTGYAQGVTISKDGS